MWTANKITTRTFVIIKHSCHRCIYLLVIIIINVIALFLQFTMTPLLKHTWFRCLLLSFGSFGNFIIRWSSYPHMKHLRGVRSFCCLSDSPAAWAFPLSFLILLKHFLQNGYHLHKKCILSKQDFLSHYFYQNLNFCQDLKRKSVEMK